MKTYTFPPDLKEDERLRFDPIQARLEELLKDKIEFPYALPQIFPVMKEWFPLEYLAITSATDNPADEKYYIHPEVPVKNTQFLSMSTSLEQIQVLQLGEPCVIKIGDQADHSVTVGFLNQFFQGKPYSILLIRNLTKNNTICTLAFLCRKKNAYTKLHVTRLFSMRGVLNHYFEHKSTIKRADSSKVIGTIVKMDHLPLIALPGMAKVNNLIWQVARQNCPVLLYGETGTGKEVVANAIYRTSARIHGPFIKINCGSIPDSLIDSELFGHDRGAYTDAVSMVKGCFERSNRGMLLLDEVGELPLLAQTRLLRVLEENLIKRVGGVEEISVDVRVIAATHKNLADMVEKKKFREDLFYRLNVFLLQIPPLRDRPKDIPLLMDFFIQQRMIHHASIDPPVPGPEQVEVLCSYSWPGNIRELQNAVESAVIRWVGNPQKKFRIDIKRNRLQSSPDDHLKPSGQIEEISKTELCTLDQCVSRHIKKALLSCNGKISGPGGAAELLQVHHNTLRAKMKKLGLLAS